jgi:internalin A
MQNEFDGQAIANQRIETEARDRTGFLDLSQLGLTELPEALFGLTHLRRLHLGWHLVERDGGWDHDFGSNDPKNRFGGLDRLEALRDLTALQTLDCSATQVSDLAPLAGLTALQTLACSETQVSDLAPLAGLTALQTLDCSWCRQVSDLAPLAGLTALQTLDCSHTQVSDLAPLAGLTALQTLHCFRTQVSDLAPLAGLTALQTLYCSHTKVSDLAPLAGLTVLQTLNCCNCPQLSVPDAIWRLPALTRVWMHQTDVAGIPTEELSQERFDNCLPSVLAFLRDRQADSEAVSDVKLLILGNGRAGKTQLTRFLNNQPFEPDSKSTHGISIVNTVLAGGKGEPDTKLHIWDFGGQDIYHGTHALFVRTQAIFLLVWARDTEPPPTTCQYEGLTFRNYPLHYWATHAAHLRGDDSPVLIVQAKCDSAADEVPDFPLSPETRKALGRIRPFWFSAKESRGHAALIAGLREAIADSRKALGALRVPAGRMRVRRRLEKLRLANGSMPEKWRLMKLETFRAWCKKARGIDSPEMFLRSLHNSGLVFYQPGLFDDRIVLDHAWALNAIYTVFDRTSCYTLLLKAGGRFDRALLAELAWKDFKPEEQKQFLGMMQSCGICFVYQRGAKDDDATYIAPDLLPPRSAVQSQIDARWASLPLGESITFRYQLLHPGLIRSVIARIGGQAGFEAIYWRGGVTVYETKLLSHALIEDAITEDDCAGNVTLRTSGGQASVLLERLAGWISQESDRLGLKVEPDRVLSPGRPDVAEKPVFGVPPSTQPECSVSYAWNDADGGGPDRESLVDQLEAKAKTLGIRLLRDKTDMQLGDRISDFMNQLASSERVFVIFSAKYLQSPYCMSELHEIWRRCVDDKIFGNRIRAYTLPDTNIGDTLKHLDVIGWWQERYRQIEAKANQVGWPNLSPALFEEIRRTRAIAQDASAILALIRDTLRPQRPEDMLRTAFDGLPR